MTGIARGGYRLLLGATAVANLGVGVTSVAYPWLATSVTRDPMLIAGLVVATQFPWLVLTLPAGAWVDRGDCRTLMASTHAGRASLTLLLAGILAVDEVPLPLLYVHALLLGSLTVIGENAAQTVLPRLVDAPALTRANGWLYVAEVATASFVGPLVGAALVAVAMTAAFAADAAAFAVAAAAVLALPRLPASGPVGTASLRDELREGLSFVRRHPTLRTLAIFVALFNLGTGAALATQVLFAQEVLRLDVRGYGLLLVAGAVGGVVGAATAGGLERRWGGRRLLLVVLAGAACCLTAIGAAGNAVVVAMVIAVLAALGVAWNAVTVAYRQRVVPERLLGRVNGVYRLLTWGTLPAGGLLGGLLVDAVSRVDRPAALRSPLLTAALLTAALFLVGRRRLGAAAWVPEPAAVHPGGGR